MTLFFIVFTMSLVTSAYAQQKAERANTNVPKAVLLHIKGAIGPGVQDYVNRGFKAAREQNATLIILQMDTPGGLGKSMRGIISDILNTKIPVVSYVAPSGARASSAGTYILYASPIAAMAPGTHLGAASPVAMGMPSQPTDKAKKQGTGKTTLERKATSDASAYIRSLAQLHGRNVAWAEKAVRKAESLSAQEALKKNVIDIVAKDLPSLLKKINGRVVFVQGEKVKLKTQGIVVETFQADWRTKLLTVITDPNIAYILLLLGMYGLFFEFANPGLIVPGVVGAIALLMGVYALQLLPISYAGLALLILGIVFMVSEAFVPSFGALGIGGIIAFVLGSVLLLDTGVPGYEIALPLILSIALISAGFFLVIVKMAISSRSKPIVSGSEQLMGSTGIVVLEDQKLRVRIRGELWQIDDEKGVSPGEKVRVIGRKGLILKVECISR